MSEVIHAGGAGDTGGAGDVGGGGGGEEQKSGAKRVRRGGGRLGGGRRGRRGFDPLALPGSPDELHAWMGRVLEVELAREPLVIGHQAPFDYVCAAYFGDFAERFPTAEVGGPVDLLVWANRGGGKTMLGAVATALDLVFKPGVQIRLLAGSAEQAARMYAHLRTLFERPVLAELVSGRVTEKRLRLENGSSVELLSTSQASVRGTRVQKVRCDEVELFKPELWEAVQLTTRSKRCGAALVRGAIEAFSTMHKPYGLMSRLVAESTQGTRRLFKWGVVDVLGVCGEEHACTRADGTRCGLWEECRGRAKERPAERAGHVMIEDALTQKRRVSLTVWRCEMLGERPVRTGCVLEEFEPSRHVVDEDVEGLLAEARAAGGEARDPLDVEGREGEGVVTRVVAGMDFGMRGATAMVWAVEQPRAGGRTRLVVVGERVASGVVLSEHVKALVEGAWPRPMVLAVDPAGGQINAHSGKSSIEVLKEAGLAVRARPAKVEEGLDLVRARLNPADGGEPRLVVHRRCVQLVKALETYHYGEDGVPVKDGADHAVDALRYLVTVLDRSFETRQRRYV